MIVIDKFIVIARNSSIVLCFFFKFFLIDYVCSVFFEANNLHFTIYLFFKIFLMLRFRDLPPEMTKKKLIY